MQYRDTKEWHNWYTRQWTKRHPHYKRDRSRQYKKANGTIIEKKPIITTKELYKADKFKKPLMYKDYLKRAKIKISKDYLGIGD